MYTFSEFQFQLTSILEGQRVLTLLDFNIRCCILKLKNANIRKIYDEIKEVVFLQDIYLYFSIYTYVKEVKDQSEEWCLDIYKTLKELVNLSKDEVFNIFGFICSCIQFGESRYLIENYKNGENGNEIIDKVNISNKSYSELFNIFFEEAVRINNSRVNDFSALWWQQYLDCYTLWLPTEIIDDTLILLNKENNYESYY